MLWLGLASGSSNRGGGWRVAGCGREGIRTGRQASTGRDRAGVV
jgi:hypothetical protein